MVTFAKFLQQPHSNTSTKSCDVSNSDAFELLWQTLTRIFTPEKAESVLDGPGMKDVGRLNVVDGLPGSVLSNEGNGVCREAAVGGLDILDNLKVKASLS